MQIRPHQARGAEFLSQRERAYLNWEPRVGKTWAAIRACDRVLAKRILVLCPNIVKSVWAQGFMELQSEPRSIGVAHGTTGWPSMQDVVIVNYDLVSRQDSAALRQIPRTPWDVVILDEAHLLKGAKSLRTKHVLGKRTDLGASSIIKDAKRVWCLSGTPCPNHYGELYPILRALHPDALREVRMEGTHKSGFKHLSAWEFNERYCTYQDSNFGRQITGSNASRGKDLMKRMDGFMDHLKLRDVAKDIPRIEVSTLVFGRSELSPRARAELAALDELMAHALENEPDTLAALAKAGMHLSRERQGVGLLKADLVANLVDYELGTGQYKKVVIFHHHRAVGQKLKDLLPVHGPVWIHGGVPERQRVLFVEAFKQHPHVKILVAQINVAQTGIDLSAADDVLIVEPSWVPAENVQAMNRVVNLNKTTPTFARFVGLSRSMDERIARALADKSAGLSALFGA